MRRLDALALRKAISDVRPELDAEQIGVRGIQGVDVGITEEDLAR